MERPTLEMFQRLGDASACRPHRPGRASKGPDDLPRRSDARDFHAKIQSDAPKNGRRRRLYFPTRRTPCICRRCARRPAAAAHHGGGARRPSPGPRSPGGYGAAVASHSCHRGLDDRTAPSHPGTGAPGCGARVFVFIDDLSKWLPRSSTTITNGFTAFGDCAPSASVGRAEA